MGERDTNEGREGDKHSLIYALHAYGKDFIYTQRRGLSQTPTNLIQRIHRKGSNTIHCIYKCQRTTHSLVNVHFKRLAVSKLRQ